MISSKRTSKESAGVVQSFIVLRSTINNQIRLKKKITELKNKLFTEQQKEKDIRKALEDFEK